MPSLSNPPRRAWLIHDIVESKRRLPAKQLRTTQCKLHSRRSFRVYVSCAVACHLLRDSAAATLEMRAADVLCMVVSTGLLENATQQTLMRLDYIDYIHSHISRP